MKKINISLEIKRKHLHYFRTKGPKDYSPKLVYYSFISHHKINNYDSSIKEVQNFKRKLGKKAFKFVIDYLDSNFDAILVLKPPVIMDIEATFYKKLKVDFGIFSKEKLELVNNILKLIFNYDNFVDTVNKFWNPNIYNKMLSISVCPYCNSQFTFTQQVIGTQNRKFKIRPDLDHFFVKSEHPMLAISLYNLVPSCNICNSKLKGSIDGIIGTTIHPFLDEFDQIAYFKREVTDDFHNKDFYSQIMGINDEYKLALVPIDIKDTERVELYETTYQLTKRYEAYKTIVNKSIKKSLLYSHNYLKSLNSSYDFKDFKKSLIGELDELDSNILSKLKKDILIKEIIPNMSIDNKSKLE